MKMVAGHAASIGCGHRRQYYPHESWSDQHTAERLVVRGFWDLLLLKSQSKEVRDEMIATIEEKLSQR